MAIPGISSAIQPLITTSLLKPDKVASGDVSKEFGSFLADALKQVNDLQVQSSQMTDDFIAGKTDNIHEVMIAGEKASVSLQFAMEIRNKVLEAYQEITRMQI